MGVESTDANYAGGICRNTTLALLLFGMELLILVTAKRNDFRHTM